FHGLEVSSIPTDGGNSNGFYFPRNTTALSTIAASRRLLMYAFRVLPTCCGVVALSKVTVVCHQTPVDWLVQFKPVATVMFVVPSKAIRVRLPSLLENERGITSA